MGPQAEVPFVDMVSIYVKMLQKPRVRDRLVTLNMVTSQ